MWRLRRLKVTFLLNEANTNMSTLWKDIQSPGVGVYAHIYSYVGVFCVDLQSFMFKSPGTGQFKRPDLGLENAGCQRAWNVHKTPYIKMVHLKAQEAQGQVQE
jgi:hypothetical protein